MNKKMGWHAKLYLNHTYLYFLNFYYVVLGLLPEPLRGLGYGLVLKRQGRGVFYDARVYIKFPWLVEIGDNVSLNRGIEIYPSYLTGHGVKIGNDVRIGPGTRFLAAGHDVSEASFQETGGDIRVGNGCWIGAAALILAGVDLGDSSVVAAGSVVTRDVPANAVVAGVPARVIRYRDVA